MTRRLLPLALLLAGCTTAGATSTESPATTITRPTPSTTSTTAHAPSGALPDMRIVDDRGSIVDVQRGVAFAPAPGVLGLDDHTVVGTKGDHVFWLPASGRSHDLRIEGAIGRRISADQLEPLVTDTAGEWVALGPPTGDAAEDTIAAGRTTTELVVVSPGADVVTVELAGNFVPEAFSFETQTGTAPWLYVLEYLPAEAPTRYRVRLLDPNTGQLSWPLNLRDKTLLVDTEMAGISRDQVVAGGRALLFTLYRGHHGETAQAYAFIHVLSMWGGVWCLEVPAELDLAGLPGVVAVSPDESTLYAVSANGFVAEYLIDDVHDPQRTPVAARVVRPMEWTDEPPVALVTDEHLVVGQSRVVTWFDRRDLTIAGQAAGPSFVEAVAATQDGDIVVAAGGSIGLAVPSAAIDRLVPLPAGLGRVTRIVAE